MMRILEGESLLNDASGLVFFRFAVAAMMTGAFSLWGATLDLVWAAAGGIAVGVGLTFALTWMKNIVSQRLGESSGSQILISLLIPFGCYLLAEKLHASGIIAAVAAGLFPRPTSPAFRPGPGSTASTSRTEVAATAAPLPQRYCADI